MVSTDKKTGGKAVKPVNSDTLHSLSGNSLPANSRPGKPGHADPRSGDANPRVNDERDVGTALRAAYQQAVEEKIPSEMLDLLGKLS